MTDFGRVTRGTLELTRPPSSFLQTLHPWIRLLADLGADVSPCQEKGVDVTVESTTLQDLLDR